MTNFLKDIGSLLQNQINNLKRTVKIVSDDLNIEELSTEKNSLVKVIDILGIEHKEHLKGNILFYIYENGKVIKKINAE